MTNIFVDHFHGRVHVFERRSEINAATLRRIGKGIVSVPGRAGNRLTLKGNNFFSPQSG